MSDRTIARALIDLSGPQPHTLSADGIPDSTLLALPVYLAELFGSETANRRDGLTTMNLPTGERAIVRAVGSKADVLLVGKRLWKYLHDPFLISDRFPPGQTTPDMDWPDELPPLRTAALLEATHVGGNGPLLLGVTQAVVDGARVLLLENAIEPGFVRDLWTMLPNTTRIEAGLSSALPTLHPKINFAILPTLPSPMPTGYLDERMVLDYPEGRYERDLQFAFEAHDERAVQELLLRRSGREMLRMGVWAVVILLIGSVATKLF